MYVVVSGQCLQSFLKFRGSLSLVSNAPPCFPHLILLDSFLLLKSQRQGRSYQQSCLLDYVSESAVLKNQTMTVLPTHIEAMCLPYKLVGDMRCEDKLRQ